MYSQTGKNIPNDHKLYQMAVKLLQHAQTGKIPNGQKIYQMTKSSIARSSIIYPNLDFWFANIPSGNPDDHKNNKWP
jgi:hypothetical protein